LAIQERWQNEHGQGHPRRSRFLTDAELDAVVGGAVALHDLNIVKHVDKASPQLYELC
jgi:type VI protein secretion system component Hcp